MALNREALVGALISQFTANQIVGSHMPAFSNAIGTAIFTFMFTGQVTAAVTGTLGAGAGTGITILGLQAPAIEVGILSQFAANGILGQYMPSIARAIAIATGTVIPITAQTAMPIAGVGVGAGTGTLVGFFPTTLSGLLVSQFAANGMSGQYIPAISNAIGVGFGSLLNGQQMPLIVSGSPSPLPSIGAGIGVLF